MPALDAKPSAPDKNNALGRLPTWLVVTVLLGLTLAFYHGLWLPGLVLIKRDAYRFFPPIMQYLIERLSAGELPQWFPYEALGCSLIGGGIGLFHPFTVLYFFLPVHDAYRLSVLISCLLAAIGAFSLGRLLHFSHAGALVAGLAFALSGYVVSLTDSVLYLYAPCALPYFCAGLEKALVARRAWVVAPAVIWATVFLNGDMQTGYYYGFIALLWTGARAPGSYREAGLRLVITGALAALLGSVQLGPAWAYFVSSERAHPMLFLEQALHWSTHPLRLVTLLASPIGEHADPAVMGRIFSWGTNHLTPWAESLYLGVPVTGLAVLGAWHRRDLRVLTLLGSLALFLALGRYGGLYEIFYKMVPLWSAFRYPEKLMGVASFAAAMLAGAGVDALRAGKGWPVLWLAAAILGTGTGLSLRTDIANAWVAATFGVQEVQAREVTGSAGFALLYSACAALGVWLVVTGIKKRSFRPEFLLAVLMAIVAFDLSRANLDAYHTGPAEMATFEPPLVQAIAAREGTLGPGRFRLFSMPETKVFVPSSMIGWLGSAGSESVANRQALDVEHNAQFHVENLNVYIHSLNSAFRRILNLTIGVAGAARYNVSYYIGRRVRVKDPQFAHTMIAEIPDFGLALFKSSVPVKPRAYLSHRPERSASPVDPAALISRTEYRSGEVDVIETTEATLPGPALGGSAVIERYAPEEVRVEVKASQPAVLILLDAFDKGWRATLESGAETPILRANALVRAVVVPAGTHVVTFAYETPLLKAGAMASLAGVFLCAGLIVQARWRSRQVAKRL